MHRGRGDLQRVGDLLVREAPEIVELHDPPLPFIKREGLRIIDAEYESHEAAREAIADQLARYYADNYPDLAEQTVDKLAKLQRRNLPKCRTRDSDLQGAWGIDRARAALEQLAVLSSAGIDCLLAIYGGRAAGIAEPRLRSFSFFRRHPRL